MQGVSQGQYTKFMYKACRPRFKMRHGCFLLLPVARCALVLAQPGWEKAARATIGYGTPGGFVEPLGN